MFNKKFFALSQDAKCESGWPLEGIRCFGSARIWTRFFVPTRIYIQAVIKFVIILTYGFQVFWGWMEWLHVLWLFWDRSVPIGWYYFPITEAINLEWDSLGGPCKLVDTKIQWKLCWKHNQILRAKFRLVGCFSDWIAASLERKLMLLTYRVGFERFYHFWSCRNDNSCDIG